MGMITTCPACDTTFKVTTEQLNAHHGDVRCGRCAKVFSAFDSLAPVAEEPLEYPLPDIHGTIELDMEALGGIPLSRAPTLQVDEPFIPPSSESALENDPAPAEDYVQEIISYEAVPEPEESPPEAIVRKKKRRPRLIEEPEVIILPPSPIWGWALGSIFLLLLLAGQAAYLYRTEIASQYPGVKPYLEQACGLLNCTVELPKNPDLLRIESSDLESDPAAPSLINLSGVISNRAKVRQAYPALELTLTHTRDEAVARRIFLPNEYLPRTTDIRAGMPASSEIALKLNLDTADLNAAGFRLYVFYP